MQWLATKEFLYTFEEKLWVKFDKIFHKLFIHAEAHNIHHIETILLFSEHSLRKLTPTEEEVNNP